MSVNSATFTAPPVDTGVVLTNQVKASALAKLVPQTEIPHNGAIFHTFTSGDATYTAEGGLKAETPHSATSIEFEGAKFTKKLILTDEFIEGSTAKYDKVHSELPQSFGTLQDEIAIGAKPKPIANFDSLAGAEEVAVGTLADFYTALDEVSSTGATVDGILFTSSYLNYLRSIVNQLGLPVFNIGGGEIDGIPYAVVQSALRVAYIGPFRSRAIWGVTAGYPKVTVTNGAVTLADGSIRTLADHNEIALIGETKIGFRVASVGEFRKLVPAVTV